MPEKTPLLGDPEVTKLFGFPGFEALIKITLRHINFLRAKHELSQISYEDYRQEILDEIEVINNNQPSP